MNKFIKIEAGAPKEHIIDVRTLRMLLPDQSVSNTPSQAQLDAAGYAKYQPTPEPVATKYQTITEETPVLSGDTWVQTWSVASVSLDKAKKIRKQELADHRYGVETNGVSLPGAGEVNTDRGTQSIISGAHSYVSINPTALIDWKGEGGWVQIDASTVTAIAVAIGAHVQTCFSNERVLSEQIDALTTVAEVEAFDITTGWPT